MGAAARARRILGCVRSGRDQGRLDTCLVDEAPEARETARLARERLERAREADAVTDVGGVATSVESAESMGIG